MKVLVLTNEKYFDFISEIVFDANSSFENDVHAWHEDRPYPFSEFSTNYDIGISFMYQHKVPAKEVNSHPWFNFHPAPLPEYKGRNLCYHAIMNGEISWGASLHYMDENFDTGDVVEVRTKFLYGDETAQDLSDLSISISKEMFLEYFPKIISGEKIEATPQSNFRVSGNYYRKSQIEELIDLDFQTVESFERSVRAISYGKFHPKIKVGGVTYKIVRDE